MSASIFDQRLDAEAERIDSVIASVPRLPMFHADDKGAVFAQHLVRETIMELFRIEHDAAKWGNGELLPIATNVHEGAMEVSYHEIESTGRAEIVADNATDLPRADVKGKHNLLPVKTVGCSFEYSEQEIATAQMQGLFDIAVEKAIAARESHDFSIHEFVRDGVPSAGLHGIKNAPGVLVMPALTSNWALASAENIVTAFSAGANAIVNLSRGRERPNTAVFPTTVFTRISTLPWNQANASNVMVLDFLKKAFPEITTWTDEPGLETAGTGGTRAIMLYRKDATKARVVMPLLMKVSPPQQRGFSFIVPIRSRFAGVMAPKPRSILRLEGV